MAAPDPREEREHSYEDEPEFKWRYEQLYKAGYPPDYAYPIAADRTIDLHKAEELIAKCGPELAYEILH